MKSGPVVSEEKWFEINEGCGQERQTTETAFSKSSLGAFSSGEL